MSANKRHFQSTDKFYLNILKCVIFLIAACSCSYTLFSQINLVLQSLRNARRSLCSCIFTLEGGVGVLYYCVNIIYGLQAENWWALYGLYDHTVRQKCFSKPQLLHPGAKEKERKLLLLFFQIVGATRMTETDNQIARQLFSQNTVR